MELSKKKKTTKGKALNEAHSYQHQQEDFGQINSHLNNEYTGYYEQ